jgi:hypothetical protein
VPVFNGESILSLAFRAATPPDNKENLAALFLMFTMSDSLSYWRETVGGEIGTYVRVALWATLKVPR